MSDLRAGFSATTLTAPRELIGFGMTGHTCVGVSDPLMIQSLVLEDNDHRVAIITVDLLAIDFQEADEIRRRVVALGFQPEAVMIAASHTHSGPPSIDFGFVHKSDELGTEVKAKAEHSVSESVRTLSRASIRAGVTEFAHNVNRRQVNWYGRAKLGVNLKGPVDHRVTHILLETDRGKLLLVCYGCHPIMTRDVPFASADYVGGLRRHAASAQIMNSMFLNGAVGDVNPYDRAKRLPLDLAGVEAAFEFGSQLACKVLNSSSTLAECENTRLSSEAVTLAVSLPKITGGELKRALLVQTVRIGQTILAAFPGEIFAQTGLALRMKTQKENPQSSLASVSCANGYIGYVPPVAEYKRGGYEIDKAPEVFGYRVPPGLAEDLQSAAERLILITR